MAAETQSANDEFITVPDAARRIHVTTNTVYNWISLGRLRREHGIVWVRGRRLVHWPTLRGKILEGEFK